MSFDFTIKDFYRKRRVNFPFILTISSIIAVSIFFILFSTSLDLSAFIDQQQSYMNIYFFSGEIYSMYSELSSILIVLIFILSLVFTMIISFAFISSKKKDISIMKAFGTLPGRIYKFYLVEVYLIFLIGFALGLVLGILFYFLFLYILNFFEFSIVFEFNILLPLILFILNSSANLIVAAIYLERIGKKSIIQTLSTDVSYHFTAERLKYLPKWLSTLGRSVKYSLLNIKRRKGKFKQYFVIFFIILIIIFTISLGSLVLRKTSRTWINKAQGEDIIMIGHKDVLIAYANMYSMFSNPDLLIHKYLIDFTDEKYIFNYSQIEDIQNIKSILRVDKRVIKFCNLQEIQGVSTAESGEIETIGENRIGNFPVIGFSYNNLVQFYEFQGYLFTKENANYTLTVGDGLANNFFESPLKQKVGFINSGEQFFISGVFIDTFYSGFAAYMDLNKLQSMLNLNSEEINIALIKIFPTTFEYTIAQLVPIINTLGDDFTCINLKSFFTENLNFIDNLTLNNFSLIVLLGIVSLFSLYNFQKGDLTEKIKDFLVMRAIGSKMRNLRRIIFLEGVFILISAIIVSIPIGLIINELILFDNVILPSLYVPILLIGIVLGFFILLNFISLIPIVKKIKNFPIREITTF
jgi:ABC-type antimicrobial peptide transport system permease subunit